MSESLVFFGLLVLMLVVMALFAIAEEAVRFRRLREDVEREHDLWRSGGIVKSQKEDLRDAG